MKSRTKVIVAAVALFIGASAFFGIRFLLSVQKYQAAVANTVLDHMDAQGLPDGAYVGEYDVGFVYAKVEVTVESGAIASIKLLEHRNDRGADAERIVEEIVAQQRLDVDAITGSTNSSTVIKKAVDNALFSARE